MSYKASIPPSPSRDGGRDEGATSKPPPSTLATLLPKATDRLGQAIRLERREARLEARVLAAHALGVSRAWLIAHDQDALSPSQIGAMEALVARREKGEPIAYILGEREFYGRLFKVTPDVLIPRPETELLIETALERLPGDQPLGVLDIGTGSGCISVTVALERPLWSVTAVDLSDRSLRIARENAQRFGARVGFLQSDIYDALGDRRFDLILSNPPYIAQNDPHLQQGDVRFEPSLALASGAEGLDALRRLVLGAPAHLGPGGWLMFEHGWNQADSARELMTQSRFIKVESLPDLAGHSRVTIGQWTPRK
ncbi:MAG: peptide chain release factor N(5)-glutamine methyltransferase [Thiobacillus sp.]